MSNPIYVHYLGCSCSTGDYSAALSRARHNVAERQGCTWEEICELIPDGSCPEWPDRWPANMRDRMAEFAADLPVVDPAYLNHVLVERIVSGAVSETAWQGWKEADPFLGRPYYRDDRGPAGFSGDEELAIARAIVERIAAGRFIGLLVLHDALTRTMAVLAPNWQRERDEHGRPRYCPGVADVLRGWLAEAMVAAEWGPQTDRSFVTRCSAWIGGPVIVGLDAPSKRGRLATWREWQSGVAWSGIALWTRGEAWDRREAARQERRNGVVAYERLRRNAGDALQRGETLPYYSGQEYGRVEIDGAWVSARGAMMAAGLSRQAAEARLAALSDDAETLSL